MTLIKNMQHEITESSSLFSFETDDGRFGLVKVNKKGCKFYLSDTKENLVHEDNLGFHVRYDVKWVQDMLYLLNFNSELKSLDTEK